jgi:hypothetical protein
MNQALAQLAARAAIGRAADIVMPALERGDEITRLQCAALQLERITLGLPAPRRGDG